MCPYAYRYCTGYDDNCPEVATLPYNTTCYSQNPCLVNSVCKNGSCVGIDVYCQGKKDCNNNCSGICGDGILAKAEECELGVNSSCCNSLCKFYKSGYECYEPPFNATSCDVPSYCTGSSASCPKTAICPYCPSNCSYHGTCLYDSSYNSYCDCNSLYTGATCATPICSQYTSCMDCSAMEQCGWCCSTQQCVQGNASNALDSVCPVWQYHQCNCSGTCLNGGICQCGSCSCSPGVNGTNCEYIMGCDHHLYTNASLVPHLDICSVCHGSGKSWYITSN